MRLAMLQKVGMIRILIGGEVESVCNDYFLVSLYEITLNRVAQTIKPPQRAL